MERLGVKSFSCRSLKFDFLFSYCFLLLTIFTNDWMWLFSPVAMAPAQPRDY
jgi:hypothetical protein